MRLKDLFDEIHEFHVLGLLIQMNVPVFLASFSCFFSAIIDPHNDQFLVDLIT